MAYQPKVNFDTLTLYLGLCAVGRCTASSTTLDTVSFGTPFNPSSVTFTPDDVGMPIAISGGGPVDAAMPPSNQIQGALFHTTIAAYISPTSVTLADAPDTSYFNAGFANIVVYRPCPMASDQAQVPVQFQFSSSIAPGTADTLQLSVLNSLGGPLGTVNPYVERFGALQLGQPVYLTSSDPDVGDIFGGYIDTLTTSSWPSVSGVYCWSLQCASWAGLAKRRVVPPATPQVFTSVAGDDVFRAIVLDYLIDDGVSVSTTSAPDITLACPVGANIGQLLDQVVSLVSDPDTAWYWYVDAWRNFVLTTRTAVAAPWSVADGTDLFAGDTPYQQSIVQTHNQMANFSYAIASACLLNTINATFAGNGSATTFNLPAPAGAVPTITLNSGAQTVGVLGVDTGKDWYWSQGSTTITQDAAGVVLMPSDALLVSYTPEVPAIAQAPNVASLQQLQAIEGTSATYEHSFTVSQPILPDDLLSLATAYEVEYGMPATTAQLYTLRPGLATGQLQAINLADAGIPSGNYLIATLQMTVVDHVLVWQYTAFGGANIGDEITALVQFINRQQATGAIVTPTVPITGAPATPVTLLQFATNSGGGAASVTLSVDVVAGDLLVAIAGAAILATMSDPPAISDTLGSTWAQAGTQASQGGFPNSTVLSILYAIAPASGPCTITVTGVGELIIAEFSNIDASTPLDVSISLASSTTPPTLTTTKDGDLIITAMSSNPSMQTVTPPEQFLDFLFQFSRGAGTNSSWGLQAGAGAFTTSLTNTPGPASCVWVSAAFARATGTAPPAQVTDVIANPTGTVTNSVGALMSGLPVIGHGGNDVTVGTKTGVTSEFASVSGVGTAGDPALWNSTGDLEAGTAGQLVPSGGSTGQVLAKASAADGDTVWETTSGSLPLTTEGDLVVYAGGSPPAGPVRLPVGSDGQVLTADSGSVNGVSWQASAGGIAILGTAVFSATGGTISGLVLTGNITGVTRTGQGQYAVAISGSPANYIVQMTVGDSAEITTIQIDPVSSYGSSGFTAQGLAQGAIYDPGLVFITIIG